MRSTYRILALMTGAVAGMTSLTHAAIINELPGNLFHQYNAATVPNVGIAANNPQNMHGGDWIGGPTNYPAGGASPILDGDVANKWSAGTFDGGGMCNINITQGAYSTDGNSFTNTPFTALETIRVWAQNWQNSDESWWARYPQQIIIAYTTANFKPNNGYNNNSDTIGVLPVTWDIDAAIAAVNGAAPTAPANPAYGADWADLTGQFTQGAFEVTPGHDIAAYVDLTVTIPAGATSIAISFGQDNADTGNPGGLAIADIQAYALAPEPASLALLSLAGTALLIRRRHA